MDTETPVLSEKRLVTLAERLTCAFKSSTTNEISSICKSGTLSHTSGGLLILNGNVVHTESLLFGHVELLASVSIKSRTDIKIIKTKQNIIKYKPIEAIYIDDMSTHNYAVSI